MFFDDEISLSHLDSKIFDWVPVTVEVVDAGTSVGQTIERRTTSYNRVHVTPPMWNVFSFNSFSVRELRLCIPH